MSSRRRTYVLLPAVVAAALALAPTASIAGQSASYEDEHGHAFRVTLRGPGTFELVQGTGSSRGTVESLVLTGTTAASRLSIDVPAGPGWVEIRSLTCATPLRELRAPECSVSGGGLDFAGGVDSVAVSEMGGTSLSVGAGRRELAPVRLRATSVSGTVVSCPERTLRLSARQVNGTSISAGAVARFTLPEFQGTIRSATRVGRIRIVGDGAFSGVVTAREIDGIAVRRARSGGGSMGRSVIAALRIGPIRIATTLSNSRILAGTRLGADGALGGVGADADTVEAGTLASVFVGGDVSGSTIGAGYDAVDGTFGNEDDGIVGGESSRIGRVTVGESFGGGSEIGAGRFGAIRIAGSRVQPNDEDPFVTRPIP